MSDQEICRIFPDTYRFYIETTDGNETEWCGLTRKQARDMYAYTDAHQPSNVKSYGWEIIRRTPCNTN